MVKLIVPTLLLKSVHVVHTLGEEHSVQVYIDKIVEILAQIMRWQKKVMNLEQIQVSRDEKRIYVYIYTFVFVEATG